ncbi:alpha/beta hydrolase [Arthrobacter sp. Helios]|uniref:alpha/beta hydrolase n=1 Tax=Arthrobacter sp. Helios TaxID=2828862 RepID=UPI00205C6D2C|nr:alpha/beta hydrolase [Arthrobacter sp. Helios]UPO76494.1 alpha/beta hydrolase [Arthrobacter sp. Helios]
MPIHPEIAKLLAALPAPPQGPLNPDAMRAGEAAEVPPLEDRLPLHAVEDSVASTPSGEVPVRIYTPEDAESYGVLVYFHGGAFFLGSLDTHDHMARALAVESGWKVVSVGYRLAPEAAFPAGLEDCYAVVKWAAEQGEMLKWDGANLAVAGDSSGGTFAAAVAAMAKDDGFDAISHQILFYPSLDLDFDVERYASMRENAVGYGLETAGLKPFNAFYLNSGADPADPLVSPIKRKDLAGLPQALVITAEFDPLRDEGELYAQRLRAAGTRAVLSRYAGANHGFVANFSWIPEFYGAFAEAGKFLRQSES